MEENFGIIVSVFTFISSDNLLDCSVITVVHRNINEIGKTRDTYEKQISLHDNQK